jgi:hypothetical protein
MRFTVTWTPLALDQLADLWVRSSNRRAVTTAQHQVDQTLRVDPQSQGLPFFGDRILVVPPLRVAFSINWMDMIVEVYDVF